MSNLRTSLHSVLALPLPLSPKPPWDGSGCSFPLSQAVPFPWDPFQASTPIEAPGAASAVSKSKREPVSRLPPDSRRFPAGNQVRRCAAALPDRHDLKCRILTIARAVCSILPMDQLPYFASTGTEVITPAAVARIPSTARAVPPGGVNSTVPRRFCVWVKPPFCASVSMNCRCPKAGN
jgi:hypothetical protein